MPDAPASPTQTRADLLAVAGESAAKARERDVTDTAALAAVSVAKVALQAAALVGPAITPSQIERAIEELRGEIAEAGLAQERLDAGDPTEFLRAVLSTVESLNRNAVLAGAIGQAYAELHGLCERLLADFKAAGTETATRIATRIETSLADAEKVYERGKAGLPPA